MAYGSLVSQAARMTLPSALSALMMPPMLASVLLQHCMRRYIIFARLEASRSSSAATVGYLCRLRDMTPVPFSRLDREAV